MSLCSAPILTMFSLSTCLQYYLTCRVYFLLSCHVLSSRFLILVSGRVCIRCKLEANYWVVRFVIRRCFSKKKRVREYLDDPPHLQSRRHM